MDPFDVQFTVFDEHAFTQYSLFFELFNFINRICFPVVSVCIKRCHSIMFQAFQKDLIFFR